jgi:hypothetical protein
MRALIVVESMFGNTRQVAAAVAEGLAVHAAVETLEVADAPTALPAGLDLLVVGGPTHAHGMTTRESRRSAAERANGGQTQFRTGIREWLDSLAPAPPGVAAAAFDTRIRGPALLWGSAARETAQRLRRLGYPRAAEPASFFVRGPLGPVVDVVVAGEIDRARTWGELLGAQLIARASRGAVR